MSKLKNWVLPFLKGADEELTDIISRKTTAIENTIREKVVIPYCNKHGYRFVAGMGTYFFVDSDGDQVDPTRERFKSDEQGENEIWIAPTEEDKEVAEILDWGFSCLNQSIGIGTWIHDYTPDDFEWKENTKRNG